MEKKAVLAIFLCVALGVLAMGGIEWLAKTIGGTPLVIACYGVIAAILIGVLVQMNRKEKDGRK